MKIAMISTWAQPCGIYTYTRDLAPALTQEGDEVYIVRVPFFGYKNPEVMLHILDNIPPEIDLIHVQHEYGIYQSLENNLYSGLKKLGKPIVTTMHAVGMYATDELISRNSDLVITHNVFCQKHFMYPSTIVHHGTKVLEAEPKEKAKDHYKIYPNTVPTVGYLGYVSPAKGLETIIEAVSKVPNVALLIAGGTHTQPDIEYMNILKERTLKVLPARCMWLGFIPEEDLKYAYGAMDFVVYPSRFTTESGAVLTAMGYGKAVIASNLPPFKEKEEEQALGTYSDLPELVTHIQTLISTPETIKNLENGARRYAEANTWDIVAKQTLDLYHKVLNSSKS